MEGEIEMVEKIRELGIVKLTQLQPSGLIIETPSGYFYDASRREVVDRLQITPLGIEAITPEGEHVLDIHHINHPDKAYDDDDLVCIGFTSHYIAMRARFGDHMVDGIAGENIIIDFDEEVWPEDLGKQIAIENANSGELTQLDLVSFAAPCKEFSHFAAQSQHKKLPADELKSILQFLGNGRRGYLLVLSENQEEVTVQPGDKVYVVSTS
jgi:hypothetical protein